VDRLYYNGTQPLAVSATPSWLRPAFAYLDPSSNRVPAFTMAQGCEGVVTRLSHDDASVIGGGPYFSYVLPQFSS
jgi:hypothetical protein